MKSHRHVVLLDMLWKVARPGAEHLLWDTQWGVLVQMDVPSVDV